jgi:hypothetical protein
VSRLIHAVCLSVALLGAAGLAPARAAPEQSKPPQVGRVSKPVIAPAQGERCVADPAFMRRNHMHLLKHQRNDTVHRGERDAPYSLKACISCHASAATGSVAAAPGDFCQSCHSYAAVKIDCFECHSSKPAGPAPHAAPRAAQSPPQRGSDGGSALVQAVASQEAGR